MSRPASAAPSRMSSSACSRPPPGRACGNQPSAIRPTRRSAGGRVGADPDRDGSLHRVRGQAGGLDVVEATVDGDALGGPQRAQHRDLLLQDGGPLLERHAEGVVLHLVPPDPETEAEAAAAEQVDLRRLLRQQRGLALGPDEDGGGEREVSAARQVGEHGQRLAEGVVDRVGTAQLAVHSGVGRRARGRRPPGGCNRDPTRPARWRARRRGRRPPRSGGRSRRCP